VAALADASLPARTQAMLMYHYERCGLFAKAEDALFALLDTNTGNADGLDFGIAFYERLRGRSDSALATGNFSHSELEAGLAELLRRKANLP
jgi:hypothetical protein